MGHEKWLVERYRRALREYEITQNHFEYCEPDFVGCAIDDLGHAERTLERILKELRHEKLDETIFENRKS